MTTAARQIDWTKFWRSITGLVLAPIVGGAVAFAAMALWQHDLGGLGRAVGLGGYFGVIFGIVPALIIGYPIHVLLMRMKWANPFVYAAVGVILAGIGYVLAGSAFGLLGPWMD